MNSIPKPVASFRRLNAAALTLAVVMVALTWLAVRPAVPVNAVDVQLDQPGQRKQAQASDRAVADGSAAGRTSTDYWLEVGRALAAP